MYYYKRIYGNNNEDLIGKYEVNFDLEKVNELKKKIIENCSIKKHVNTVLSDKSIAYIKFNRNNIKNFVQGEKTGESDWFEDNYETYYMCSYDELTLPPIISLIDGLIDGDEKVINMIINPININFMSLDEEIKLKKEEIKSTDDEDVEKKIKKLNELKDLLEESRLNKDIVDYKEYYPKLQELISFNEVDVISQEYVDNTIKTLKFFDNIDILKEFEIRKLIKER